MATPVEMQTENERELVLARRLAAPTQALYRCWTDPELIPKVFGTSTTLNGAGPLTWPERELVNATTSRLNQCFY